MRRLALLLLLAIFTLPASPEARAAQSRGFVLATDFGTGTIAGVAFGPPRAVTPNVAAVCADAVLRHHQGLLYVIERFGCDNVRVLDPANGYQVVRQFSVGNGANPNDIVIVSPTKAYVTRYDSADLWIVNPSTGAFVGAISLAAFADADGIPEMNRMVMVGGRVFVTVQRIDRDAFFTPTDSSAVVVIDAATDAVVDCDATAPGLQGILLPFQNPTTELVVDAGGRLIVGCTGFYGANDGGVVRIDPLALAVDGIETTEAALGGDVADVVPATAGRAFAVLSDASFNTVCKPYDRASGAVGAVVYATTGFNLADAEVNDRGELWLCDRTPANPGIRVFDVATLAPLAGPLSTGLPPLDIEFDGSATTGVPATGGPAPFAFAGAWPNPSRGDVVIRVRLAPGAARAGSPLRATILDAAGRRVRALEGAAGAETLRWDGRDDAGRTTGPGIYAVRLEIAGETAAGRLVRLPSARL
jgi:hypothetical protein